MPQMKHCLVTGASGYIGGRLVPELLSAGHRVRCMARDAGRLRDRPWAGDVEIAQADVLDEAALTSALDGIEVAYYLIHSLGTAPGFEERDAAAATTFAQAAAAAGVHRVVYLGGIFPRDDGELSPHLRSRQQVGDILLAGQVPAIVLQAAVIIGSGSASFEMLRYLTERLPVMMRTYARVAGLSKRLILPVPLLTPQLSSLWVGLVTPVPAGLARPLVESLRNRVVCAEHDIASYLPDPPWGLIALDRAVALGLRHVRSGEVATRWSAAAADEQAGELLPSDPLRTDPAWSGGSLYLDERIRRVHASADALWHTIEGIGGERGWYSFPVAWGLRGLIDRLAGGGGLHRGRRDPDRLEAGDPLDFWRVEAIEPGHLLRLRAEMKLPGRAWLEFSIRRDPAGGTIYRQRAIFRPVGLIGQAYWLVLRPFHGIIFGSMLRNLASTAGRATQAASSAG
jgi:hypothetical protein